MNILITGAGGFIGKNLVANLSNIKENKNRTRPKLCIDHIFLFSHTDSEEKLKKLCSQSDYVIHLAGVNRPVNKIDYEEGNPQFTSFLVQAMAGCTYPPRVIFASSIQATLLGRYSGSVYGRSKKKAEELLFQYAEDNHTSAYIYRFPNVYGKWCRPDYNSAVATFCHSIANGESYTVNDEYHTLELLYIDDLLEEIYDCLEGHPHRCNYLGLDLLSDANGKFCYAPKTSFVTLGRIVKLLQEYKRQPETLEIHNAEQGSFEKKLFATFLSYLSPKDFRYPLKMNVTDTGSFTELIRTAGDGQFSVNKTHPGAVRGQHWHNTKWEIFVVVSGQGLIQQRKYGDDQVFSYEVNAEKLEAVRIPPGYVHNLINTSKQEELVTLIWANEQFDPNRPDTYREIVE